MKKFVNPTLDVEKLDILDVITTSGVYECTEDSVDCPNDSGII